VLYKNINDYINILITCYNCLCHLSEVALPRNRSTTEREAFSTTIKPNLIKQLKHIAVDEGCSLNDLLEEAIGRLIEKRKNVQPEGQEPNK